MTKSNPLRVPASSLHRGSVQHAASQPTLVIPPLVPMAPNAIVAMSIAARSSFDWRMAVSPVLAHGGAPSAIFGILMFLAMFATGISMLESKKPEEKKTGCITLIVAGVLLLVWFVYSYWDANHKPH